ncbi:MAG: HlyD family efflux transporter periplasmic adaptor subunit [Verrucomicrobiota bacterium]
MISKLPKQITERLPFELTRSKLIALGAAAVALLVWIAMPGSGTKIDGKDIATFEVRRGLLPINVLEGGNIHALESLEIKSEVKPDGTKILFIVEEGYEVTEEDVEQGKILVELDTNPLKEKMFNHEVEFQTDYANYLDADQNRSIQASETASEIKETRQIVRFALLDFEKYLGTDAAHEILKERELPYDAETLAQYEESWGHSAGDKDPRFEPAAAAVEALNPTGESVASVDFIKYIKADELGDGEAQQILRQLGDELLVAESELALAEESYQGSQRLAEKQFISQTELENEAVALDKKRLDVKTAETALELFRKYEFNKMAEQYLSVFEEALQKLNREKREAEARIAQADVKFKSAKRRFELEEKEKEDLEYQLSRTIIRAEIPGLVAYGGEETNYYKSRYYDPISEGVEVRYGQPIITIPDMTKMAVTVNIHESYVKKVDIGQPARVTVDAEPGKILTGEVAELAVLPDSANMRYNPNLKVYPAAIHIDGTHDWLKPGMTAQVEIVVNEISDALHVPVQSIFVVNDEHFCFVKDGGRVERRPVEVGDFNDEFIEINSGLEEGELVFLSPPADFDQEAEEEQAALAKADT